MTEWDQAYSLMLRICGVAIVIDAGERIFRRSRYADRGLFSWRVFRQRLVARPAVVRWLADRLFSGANRLTAVLVIRIAAACLVGLSRVGSPQYSLGLTLLVISHVYVVVRTGGFGIMGSDLMALVICGGAWLATVVASGPVASQVGLWFIAAQSCLGYAVAGIAKLRAPKWRSGEAMVAVLSTHTYGSPRLHALVKARPKVAAFLCWSVMLWETSFPLVLLAPDSVRIFLFVSGVGFHASLAALMGLNLFLFTFSSTYVAIWAVTR